MQTEAGVRPWSEFHSWCQLARWYVGSQLQVLDRNFTFKPQEPGLARVIAYVGTHAAEILELNPEWANGTGKLRGELNSAAPDEFSRNDGERDMEILREFRRALQRYRIGTGDKWGEVFEKKYRVFSGVDSPTFELPKFDEIDLAISTVLDLFGKYSELILGQAHDAFALGYRRPQLELDHPRSENDRDRRVPRACRDCVRQRTRGRGVHSN